MILIEIPLCFSRLHVCILLLVRDEWLDRNQDGVDPQRTIDPCLEEGGVPGDGV